MTTHELAHVLLQMDEMPAFSYGDEGYCEISSIIPATLFRRDPFITVEFNVPVTREQKSKSFRAFILT